MGQLLDEAIIFATHAHAGQVRKMANTPYILHPLEVAEGVGVDISEGALKVAERNRENLGLR